MRRDAEYRVGPATRNSLLGTRYSAFTIVELLVSIALVLMLMGVAVFIFIGAVKIFMKTSAETEVYQAAQVAMESLRRDIQGAIPLLTQDQVANGQQFVVQFDEPGAPSDNPAALWRFDRLCFRTTTADPATGASADRWVFYWVQGHKKGDTPPVMGTLMKYVSPAIGAAPNGIPVPPWKTGAVSTIFGEFEADAPVSPNGDWGGATWLKDDAELCQNVTFFGVEVFYDPDTDSRTIGGFFNNAKAAPEVYSIQTYPTYNLDEPGASLGAQYFPAYVLPGPPGYLALNAYSFTGYPAPIASRYIRLPTTLRITLRVRDRDVNAAIERTFQFNVQIPVAN